VYVYETVLPLLKSITAPDPSGTTMYPLFSLPEPKLFSSDIVSITLPDSVRVSSSTMLL
jgi:hypothetical protein